MSYPGVLIFFCWLHRRSSTSASSAAVTSFRYCGGAEARVFRDLDSRDAIVVPDHQILYALFCLLGTQHLYYLCGFLRGSSSEVGLCCGWRLPQPHHRRQSAGALQAGDCPLGRYNVDLVEQIIGGLTRRSRTRARRRTRPSCGRYPSFRGTK